MLIEHKCDFMRAANNLSHIRRVLLNYVTTGKGKTTITHAAWPHCSTERHPSDWPPLSPQPAPKAVTFMQWPHAKSQVPNWPIEECASLAIWDEPQGPTSWHWLPTAQSGALVNQSGALVFFNIKHNTAAARPSSAPLSCCPKLKVRAIPLVPSDATCHVFFSGHGLTGSDIHMQHLYQTSVGQSRDCSANTLGENTQQVCCTQINFGWKWNFLEALHLRINYFF